MEEAAESKGEEEGQSSSQRNGKERPPAIILTAQINLLKFQGEIKAITKGSFELRNVRKGTKVLTRVMTDYLVIKKHLEQKK